MQEPAWNFHQADLVVLDGVKQTVLFEVVRMTRAKTIPHGPCRAR